MKEHNMQNRRVAVIESGSWAIASGKQVREHLESMKNMTVAEPMVSILSAIRADQCKELEALSEDLLGGNT